MAPLLPDEDLEVIFADAQRAKCAAVRGISLSVERHQVLGWLVR